HPGLYALKYVYRYLHVTPVDLAAGKVRVKNWFDFLNPKDLAAGTWEVKQEGKTIASGALPPLDIEPRAEKEFTLALPPLAPTPGAQHLVNFSFKVKHDTCWAQLSQELG